MQNIQYVMHLAMVFRYSTYGSLTAFSTHAKNFWISLVQEVSSNVLAFQQLITAVISGKHVAPEERLISLI